LIRLAIQRLSNLLFSRGSGSDDNTRGADRERRAVTTGGISALARIVQLATSFVTVPLTLKYLGNERFGLWMTISSVLAMAAFADFGVGNGVLNTVANAFGRDDVDGIRKAVSSGFAVLWTIAAALLLLFFSIYGFISWADFFRVSSLQARAEAGPALAVFAVCFAFNIAMDVVQRVQLGLQQGYRYGLWQLIGSCAGFVGVIYGIWLHMSLPMLIVAIAGAPLLATALNVVHFFGYVRPDLRPTFADVSINTIVQIGKLGGLFFVLQLVVAVSFSADNFIIARILGAINVPEYSVPQRIFAVVAMMLGMLVAPLWPAYGEAVSRGDIAWVRRTLRRSVLLVFVISAGCAVLLLLFSHQLILWWVGPRIHPTFFLLLGLAVWTVVTCCGDALAVFLNGISIIKFQVVVAAIFGFGCLATKVFFIHQYGITGIPWATILTYLVLSAGPCVWYVIVILKRLRLGVESGPNEAISVSNVDSGQTHVI
jgi:O-antigen/teichoic acid export membrane protein